jgi:hypothetical protein
MAGSIRIDFGQVLKRGGETILKNVLRTGIRIVR